MVMHLELFSWSISPTLDKDLPRNPNTAVLCWIDSTCAPNGAITFSLWDFIARIVPHGMSIPSVVALITILDVESLHIWLFKSGLKLNHQMFARFKIIIPERFSTLIHRLCWINQRVSCLNPFWLIQSTMSNHYINTHHINS